MAGVALGAFPSAAQDLATELNERGGLMAVNDMYRVIYEGILHGQTVVNVFHYRQTAEGFEDDGATGLAARFAAVIAPLLKSIQSAEFAHTRVIVQHFFPLPPRVPVVNATAAGAGGVAGGSLPSSVTGVLTKMTPFAGPKWRGRVYVAGVPVSSENDSQLSNAAQMAWQAAANAMNVTLTSGGNDYQMVLWHKATSTATGVNNIVVRPVLRSQRRRQVGRGI